MSDTFPPVPESRDPDHILSLMTGEEKLSLLSGRNFWQTRDIPRLGIPSVYLADGPNGVRRQAAGAHRPGFHTGLPATCYPSESTVANSWNLELGRRVGEYLAREARSLGVGVLLGPGINIKRHPLGGRNFEYFSEDPYLAGMMASAYVRGIQSQGVAACIKHFCARNQETHIMAQDVGMDMRTLREIHLTPFEICVRQGAVRCIMAAPNRVNGRWVTEDPFLLDQVLRREWGFAGPVLTDWGASNNRTAGLAAGTTLEMPGTAGESDHALERALKDGRMDQATVDREARRILELALAAPCGAGGHEGFDVDLHHRISQKMAEESIVLLKNEDGILPVPFGKRVALVGDFAREPRFQGSGSSLVQPTRLDHTLDSLAESGITSCGWARGFRRDGRDDPDMRARACDLAARAEVVLVYLGLDEESETQGRDRTHPGLPANQVRLLEDLYRVNRNLVVVLSCGSVVEMPWTGKVKGLLHAYLGGQSVARAVLRVVSGDTNPSGRLAETCPLGVADCPAPVLSSEDGPGLDYSEGIFTGYRYYNTHGIPVLFPFGFGLSYTRFRWEDLKVTPRGITLRVVNEGDRPGMEVVQMYIGHEGPGLPRPRRELKGFAKVLVNPGQSREVEIPFDGYAFRIFHPERNCWVQEGGRYRIMACANVEELRLEGFLDLPELDPGPVAPGASTMIREATGSPPVTGSDSRILSANDLVSRLRTAPSWRGRLIWWLLCRYRDLLLLAGRRNRARMVESYVMDGTFRSIARLSGGRLTDRGVEILLGRANGKIRKGRSLQG